MPRKRRRGFTLVELIVATGITVVLAAMLLSVTGNILGSWNRTRGKLMTSNQAKLALDQIKSDLQNAVIRMDGNAWMAATILDLDGSTNLATHGWQTTGLKSTTVDVADATKIEDCRFGVGGMWLRLIGNGTTQIDDDGDPGTPMVDMAAPSAVAYQIVRRPLSSAAGAPVSYALCRSDVLPENTFTTGYDLDPASANAYATPDSSAVGLPGNIVSPHRDQAIAMDVVDFGVRLLTRDSTGEVVVFPNGAHTYLVKSGNAVPSVIEIMLRVLTPEGATMIENLEAGKITGDWWAIADAHSSVYTTRVALPSAMR